jgi:hypothetical protein
MALDSITQMPNLPITSAFKASLPAAPKGRIGPAEIAPAAEELSSAISTASQKVGEADVNIKKAEREEQAIGFEKRAEGKRKFVEDIKIMPEREAYKEAVKQERGMEFVPTRDTVQDIAGLFGLLGVVGMVIGKGNAMQAMGAMNGMMEGHRKGRQDLYKQELQQFEKNFKAMQAKVSAALADLQEALKVKQYDNEAGDLEIQAVLARSESPFLKAVKDKQGDAAVLERLKEVNKSVTVDMPRTINDLQEKADAKADAERRFKLQMEQRERIARLQREAKTPAVKAQGQNALTFASRVYGNIENATNDLVNLTNLPAVAESPIFAGMIGADRDTVLRNITAFAARKVTDKDQRAFEQIANSLDAALARLEAQGLATGATKAAIQSFGALKPREGDDAINMAIYLARVKQEIETGIKVHAEMPGATPGQKQNNIANIERINKTVPFSVEDTLNVLKANRKPLGKKMEQLLTQPQIVPNVNMESQDRQSRYEMGQVIKKGNKTYRIIGLDDPNDPDIEEVK